MNRRLLSPVSPLVLMVAALSLNACAVAPTPTTPEERAGRVERDLKSLFEERETVGGPITLYQAQAYALKYNLDNRVKMMEHAVAMGISQASGWDMLPQVAASAGYTVRDNDAGSRSKSLLTGATSLEPSTSVERAHTVASLSVAWNVLDFGVSYMRARQQADRALIAEERRRKVVHTVMQDVRAAYWRALGEQRLMAELDPLMVKVQQALDSSQTIERSRLQTPTQALEYQKTLLDTMRQLQQLRRELSLAKYELASLMNLDPKQPLVLAAPADFEVRPQPGPLDPAGFENTALLNRPELREEDYQARISADETRKAMLRMLPGVELSGGFTRDTNSYLYNQSWAEAGLKLTWNILNVLSGPDNIAVAENQEKLAEVRRLALSMAVMTQVNVGLRRFRQAQEDYAVAAQLASVDDRLYEQAAAGEQVTQNELELIRRATSRLFSRLRRDLAFVEMQNAAGAVQVSIGKDPVPEAVESHDVNALASALEAHSGQWSLLEPIAYAKAAVAETDGGVSPLPQSSAVAVVEALLAAAPPPPPSADEAVMAHLASYKSTKAALKGWKNISVLTSTSGLSPLVRPVDIPGRGTLFRLYADGPEAAVRDLCNRLHDKTLYCVLHRRADQYAVR